MGEYWNTALTARMVLEACETRGIYSEPILQRAGIARATLEDPEGRLSLDQMQRFWQEALAQSGDPALGFHAGGAAPHGFYGLLDYIISYSNTVGDALTRFGDYLPLINNWVSMRIETHDHAVHAVTAATIASMRSRDRLACRHEPCNVAWPATVSPTPP